MIFLRLPYALVQWTFWGAVKFVLFLIGIPAVFLSLLGDGRTATPKMWRMWAQIDHYNLTRIDGRTANINNWSFWKKYWWFAFRNPVGGMSSWFDAPVPSEIKQRGSIDESQPGFQWRYRYSGWFDSFRIAWGDPDPSKGKNEFYVGWKLGSSSPFKFTAQVRPVWIAALIVAAIYLVI